MNQGIGMKFNPDIFNKRYASLAMPDRIGIRRSAQAFTIVELLIVIVVIGILAAITVVAYNGIQNRANDAALQADLGRMAKSIQSYAAINSDYPDVGDPAILTQLGLKPSRASYDVTAPAYAPTDLITRNLIICIIKSGAAQNFGIAAMSKSGTVYSYSQSAGPNKESYTWAGQKGIACPRLGVSDTTNAAFVRAFAFESSLGGWQAGW
jgi:prepilin-type N-terminal cleavage/methylation domain-containing protein